MIKKDRKIKEYMEAMKSKDEKINELKNQLLIAQDNVSVSLIRRINKNISYPDGSSRDGELVIDLMFLFINYFNYLNILFIFFSYAK
jgi:hypothetical protein